MNQDSSHQTLQWSGQEQLDDTMASMREMDFTTFLDIGDLDLSSFSPLGHDLDSAPDANAPHMGDLQSGGMIHDFGADQFELPMAMGQEDALHTPAIGSELDPLSFIHHTNNQSWAAQDQQVQNGQDQIYHQPQHVPPTPNSYELHGSSGHHFHQHATDAQARQYLDQRYHHLAKDDAMAAFTPLVSPAVTPQDSHFHTLSDYTTLPGAYFSPLTSPALQAQNAHRLYGYHANPSTAGSSVATSPIDYTDIDMDMDMDMMAGNVPLLEAPRRTRKKMQAPRSTGPTARIRQSPIVKPQQKRRSTHLSSIIPVKDVQNILREAHHATSPQGSTPLTQTTHITDGSSTDSISPETLSESIENIMGPPPRPMSAVQSPALHAQSQSAPASTNIDGSIGAPATPASLMSLQRARQLQGNNSNVTQSMQPLAQHHDDMAMCDDFALPPAANTIVPLRPDSERIVTGTPPVSANATPRMKAHPASKKSGSATPLSALAPLSTHPSPSICAVNSPALVATPASLSSRSFDNKTIKNGRKRAGVVGSGNVLISPAIRPKISPSIKPLLPDGANLSESQQAMLLASKSNYTHMLEGTLLPGVTYPESLSSGLTSKRTSHKIAEQGRRNRINDALKEMQSLLPKIGGSNRSKSASGNEDEATGRHTAEDDDDVDCKDGGAKAAAAAAASAESKSASSKAATVESAIDYIKILQLERMQTVQMLRARDAEIAALKQKLLAAGSSDDADMDASANAPFVSGAASAGASDADDAME